MKETAISRIPFHKDKYMEIPMDDCRLMADGKILSAYIYDVEVYRIVDRQRKLLGEKRGTEVEGYYEIRKIKRGSMLEER